VSGAGFAKLFSSIVTSSVWVEDHATVRVWVAMLATCDAEGIVEGSIPGFANLARVSIEEMERAVERLSSPDPHSRTPDYEGRRIEPFPGGWRILNHATYRQRGQGKEGSRAPYFRAYRKRQKEAAERSEKVLRNVARNKVSASASVSEKDEDAARFVAVFNQTFGRRVGLTPKLGRDFATREGEGYAVDLLVALPLLVDAQGLPDDLRAKLQPAWLLRNGERGYTTRDGERHPGKRWIEDALGRADETRLWPRHVEIASQAGCLEELRRLGCRIAEGES
jgi:hypothetical protein